MTAHSGPHGAQPSVRAPIPVFGVHESAAFERWLAQQERALVQFGATTCEYTHEFQPHFERLAPSLPYTAAIRELDLQIDAQWDEHHIERTPTLVLFERGRETARLASGDHVTLRAETFQDWLRALP